MGPGHEARDDVISRRGPEIALPTAAPNDEGYRTNRARERLLLGLRRPAPRPCKKFWKLMSVLTGLHHATRYVYDRPVALGPQMVRLRPAPHCRTRVPGYSLTVTPQPHFVNWLQDPHGNWIARFVFPEKTTEISVTVDLLADLEVFNPFDFFIEPSADKFPFTYAEELREELAACLEPEPAGPRLKALLNTLSLEPRNTVDYLVELNQVLQRRIRYVIRMEHGVQTPEETLESEAG